MNEHYKKLNIIWTLANYSNFRFIIIPLINENFKHGKRVQLTIWGQTTKFVTEQEKVQNDLRHLMEQGVTIVACKESAELHKVREQLEAFGGIEIKQLAKRALDDSSGPDEKIMML